MFLLILSYLDDLSVNVPKVGEPTLFDAIRDDPAGRLPPPNTGSTSLQEAIASRLRTSPQPTHGSGEGDASATASPNGVRPVTVISPREQSTAPNHSRVMSGETGAQRRDLGSVTGRVAGNSSSPRKIKSMMGRLLRGIWNE